MRRAAAAAAAVLIAVAGCSDGSGGDAPEARPGEPEPTWSVPCEPGAVPVEPIGELALPCLGDQTPAPVGARDGRPLVIVLWASWCGPCVEEAPEVEAFHREFGDRVDVLGVDTADILDRGRWFAEDHGLTYPSVFDADEAVRVGLGVPALPAVAFVTPDGTVSALLTEPGVTAERLAETAEDAFDLEPT